MARLGHTGLTQVFVEIKNWVLSKLSSKADDSSVVHTTGDETIGGYKTFSNDIIFKSTLSFTEKPTSAQYMCLAEYDKDNQVMFSLQYANRTSYRDLDLYVVDYTGSNTGVRLSSEKKFYPITNNEYDLGTSTLKWGNVYSTTLTSTFLNVPAHTIQLAFSTSALSAGEIVAGSSIKRAYYNTSGTLTKDSSTLLGSYIAMENIIKKGYGLVVKIA